CNFTLAEGARLSFGTPVFLANYSDFQGFNVTFTRAGVQAKTNLHNYQVRYEQLVAYRLAADGTLSLLRRLPAGLLPEGSAADRYEPLARMLPGPAVRPRYFR